MSFFELTHQCCDADHYLQMGKACAELGDCYNQLRPLGNAYWFSVPYRLGLGAGYFVVAHLLLTLASILLSVISLQYFFKDACHRKWIVTGLFVVSVVAHIVFLYPVFRVSLSDLPASLFFLSGVWCLIAFHFSQDRYKVCWMIVAGIMFGAAVWMRIYFFGPVLLLIFIRGLGSFIKEKPDGRENFLLIAMIPVFIQFAAVYQHAGYVAYAEKDISNEVKRIHQTIHASGWDTVLPVIPTATPSGWPWPTVCEGVICRFMGKAYFYLGSYAPKTYHVHEIPKLADYQLFSSDCDHASKACESITLQNIRQESVKQMKPDLYLAETRSWQDISETATDEYDGEIVLARRVSKESKLATAEAFQTLVLEKGYRYAFALWAWTESKHINVIELFIRRHGQQVDDESNSLLLFQKPQFVDVITAIDETSLYDVGIRWQGYAEGSDPGKIEGMQKLRLNQEAFYLWDLRLQRGLNDAWEYPVAKDAVAPARWWSPVIFVINLVVLIFCLGMLYRILRENFLLGLSLGSILLSISLVGFALVPEQRFFIATMILMWLFAFVHIITWIFSDRASQTAPD